MIELLECLQRQVRRGFAAGSEVHEVAGFRVHIWHNPDVFYRNRALAMRRPESWAAAIDEMGAVFARADRVPRIELFAELWPDLPTALERAGWVCEAKAPVMVLAAGQFQEPPPRADIVLLDGDPLEGYWNWLKTKVTITEGKVVVDKR